MSDENHYTSIGLMSGTSMDAVDVALLRTDGESLLSAGPWTNRPYPTGLREALLELSTDAPDLASYEDQVTQGHIDAVRDFCSVQHIDLAEVDCVGFHGQTIKHEPHLGKTWQLGVRPGWEVGRPGSAMRSKRRRLPISRCVLYAVFL